ncbi:alanine racemase [Pseudomaricurvus alkylphenolicus]|uniref:alanine racemase n=1 Tax=Pseudomaricurvus alkylphenolicus TaxID=1306991 RepID=UPI0014233724|nr:alanine racemase [Pseudomaricurvus alkylphenolicus]NIB42738.1 alanine racemase [Pseudomaricurvus alkylphenolicus]
MSRPAQAIVDLAAVRHNFQLAQSLAPSAQTLGVVKANAYGHGAVEVAKTLEPLAPALAVACIEEAIELREAGIRKPILLLEGPFESDEVKTASEQEFWLMASGPEQVDMIANAEIDTPVRVWLKADSGMHRLGLMDEQLRQSWEKLQPLPHVDNDIVLATHFAAADELDSDFTQQQIDNFAAMAEGINAPVSMANSAGILGWEQSRGDYNRPGIMLYGASPFPGSHPEADKLKPVMTLKSKIIGLRTIEPGETVGYGRSWIAQRRSVIATVAMGYGDGYPRHAPNGTPIMVNGQQAQLAGRVSMDMITVDVTDLTVVQVGDEVECWGQQLAVNDIAERAGTIGYELITRMPLRTPRVYINHQD